MLRELSDTELWVRIKNNEQEALTQLFQRHYFFLIRSGLSYVKDPELAKDAANDVFYGLWSNRQSLSDVSNVKAYLSTSFRNQLLKLIRSNIKNKDQLQQWQYPQEDQQVSYEEIMVALQVKEEQKLKLRRALEQLSPRQKEYLQLKYYEGLSYEQIAEKTGQVVKTVYNTVYEAIKILRREIRL
jgi:RNA polymerase sigma factor (sigma-70 family)